MATYHLNEEQRAEVHAALTARVDDLKALKKKAVDAITLQPAVHAIDRALGIIRGDGGDAGLLATFSAQQDMFSGQNMPDTLDMFDGRAAAAGEREDAGEPPADADWEVIPPERALSAGEPQEPEPAEAAAE